MSSGIHRLALAAAVTAFCVVVLGAFVRLSDAGLGCPDWPGCYGHLTWPAEHEDVMRANESFPDRPVEHHKAWKEMVHRYLAGALVLMVAWINVLAWKPKNAALGLRGITTAILVLILFQAALGMWTVTLKLLPVVVLAHLLGGMATLALLAWLALRSKPGGGRQPSLAARRARPLVFTAITLLIMQIALGGWTSANYAALACPDLPGCHGSLWPEADYAEGFTLWREIGVDYEGGVLDLRARVAIHYAHRLGAVAAAVAVLILVFALLRSATTRRGGLLLLALLAVQLVLGILNVAWFLPLPNAVLHNAFAALLLVCLTWQLQRSGRRAW